VPALPLHVDPTVDLGAGFDAIRAELGISEEFPPDVQAAAEAAAARTFSTADRADRRDVPFVTIDPEGSLDLDQAVSIAREGDGYLVQYAIADVAAFVEPGGPIDAEARRRGVTVYLPDGKVPLHPTVLSEGAVSLLPDADRPALVWRITLDAAGEPTSVHVDRSLVRSRAKLSYAGVQAALDAGTADEQLVLLRDVGRLREQREIDRGGVSLPIPEQQVVEIDGRYHLEYRAPLPVEGWNSQISLLTGICAARLMVDGGIGVLRTLPPPDEDTVDTLRRRAKALRVPWPADGKYEDLIRSLDPTVPAHAALLIQSARLFRGAGYVGFTAGAPAGDAALHAAVAAPYAHVTAPLRRLVDRFGNEVVLALCAGTPVPSWAADALETLPALMAEGTHREGAANGMALDLVEASVLSGCVGADLEGVVTGLTKNGAQVQIREPAVVATVKEDGLKLGTEVCLRVEGADLAARRVHLAVEPVS
jgi:exoribonuclease R